MSFWRTLSVCVVIFSLSACVGQEAAPQISSTATVTSLPTSVGQSQAFVVPTPASGDVGIVAGKLLKVLEGGGTKPFANLPLYLGTVLKSEQGVEGLVELTKSKAPSTKADAEGNFAFTDVKPGRYGLMIDTPRGAVLLNQPSDGKSMIIEIVGGQTDDLGEMKYDIPLDLDL